MKSASTTKFKLDPANPPVTDWTEFDKLTEAEIDAAAAADPDCPPITAAQAKRGRRPGRQLPKEAAE
jgi:hypothetical protein